VAGQRARTRTSDWAQCAQGVGGQSRASSHFDVECCGLRAVDGPHEERNQPSATALQSVSKDFRSAVTEFERGVVVDALARHQQNWAAVARDLGRDRANLNRLAKRLGLK
jgi:transcriptional regulator with GAF, ATPase, and Fis domain